MATIKYWGHACFAITSLDGPRILVDPYLPGGLRGAFKYEPITDEVEVVLVTHEHSDHNSVEGLSGQPLVLRTSGVVQGVSFVAIPAKHDPLEGRERGDINLFVWETDGLRFCHLGDLGHLLTPEQAELVGSPDVLFIPTGGHFTVDPPTARRVMTQLQARVTIPMHYLTPRLKFPPQYRLAPVEAFTEGLTRVVRVGGPVWEVSPHTLPAEPTVVVLEAVE